MLSESSFHGSPQYLMENVPQWPVSLSDRCPSMTGVPQWPVSLNDRCPSMTGVPQSLVLFKMGKIGRHYEKMPPDYRLSSHQSPLKLGFTIVYFGVFVKLLHVNWWHKFHLIWTKDTDFFYSSHKSCILQIQDIRWPTLLKAYCSLKFGTCILLNLNLVV